MPDVRFPKDPPLNNEAGRSVEAGRYAPYFLSIINNRLSWGASQLYLSMFDIGLNEWRILSALRNEPGIQALRIGEMVAMNKSVVSRSSRKLEKDGYVYTRLVDSRRLLWLTQKGAELHDKIIKIAYQREAALLEGFSEAEKDVLFDFLKRMKDNLENVDRTDKAVAGN